MFTILYKHTVNMIMSWNDTDKYVYWLQCTNPQMVPLYVLALPLLFICITFSLFLSVFFLLSLIAHKSSFYANNSVLCTFKSYRWKLLIINDNAFARLLFRCFDWIKLYAKYSFHLWHCFCFRILNHFRLYFHFPCIILLFFLVPVQIIMVRLISWSSFPWKCHPSRNAHEKKRVVLSTNG